MKCAARECGELSKILFAETGTETLAKWYADNSDILGSVSYMYYIVLQVCMHFIKEFYAGARIDCDDLFGRGNRPHVNRMFSCTGDEERLFSCSSHMLNLNTVTEVDSVLGVMCQGDTSRPTECRHGDVRLVNGSRKTEGRLEICAYGYWAVACNRFPSADLSALACKQLGLPAEGIGTQYHNYSGKDLKGNFS